MNRKHKILYLIILLFLFSAMASSCASNAASSPLKKGYTGAVSGDITTCFYRFTDVYKKRIYGVLSGAPGVKNITRTDHQCEGDCICYEMDYNGKIERLEDWIKEKLRTSKSLEFRLNKISENRLEAWFQGGFE